jgi:predicted nucleotidyltransferase
LETDYLGLTMKPAAQSLVRFPLNLVFDSPANVRVLRVLARHGGMLTASTVADSARLTKPSVLSALRQLVEAGMVEALGSDRQRLYRFAEHGVVGPALAALFEAESQNYRDFVDTVRAAAESAGAESAWLYGSVARGEDRPGSDIDIAVVGASDQAFNVATIVREKLTRAWRRLDLNASVVGIDRGNIVRLEREEDPWWVAVKRDAVVVMGPAPEAYLGKPPGKLRRAR